MDLEEYELWIIWNIINDDVPKKDDMTVTEYICILCFK